MLKLKEKDTDTIDVLDLREGQIAVIVYHDSTDIYSGKLVQRNKDDLISMGEGYEHSWPKLFTKVDCGRMRVKPLKTGDILEYTEDKDDESGVGW